MRAFLGGFVLLGIGLAGNAATITTQTQCFDWLSGRHDFSVDACTAGSARAAADGSFTEQATAADYMTVMLHSAAVPGYAGTATSLVSITDDLYTAGAERSGYIQVLAHISDMSLTVDSAGGNTSVAIGSYSLSCGWSPDLYESCSYRPIANGSTLVPFMLGVPFSLTASQGVAADSSFGGSADGRSTIQFRFFESDGVTPVSDPEVASAPEPGTWGMILLGALAAALFKLRSCGITIKAKPPQGLLCLGAVIVAAAVSTVPAFGSVIYRYEDKYWQAGPFENYPHDFIEVTAPDYIQGSATFSGSQINCSNCSGTGTISLTQHSVADAPYPFDSDVEMQFDDNGSSHSEWFYGARLDADGVFFEGAPSYGNRPVLIIKDPPDTPVPEPGTLAVTGIACCAGLIAFRRRG